MRRLPFAVLVAALLALGPPSPSPASAAPPAPVSYRPPVAAPVVDPFRPPATPYGPGNRGLEYATVPGTPVGTAAAGVVTFAGQVGGSRHVTVQHADGLRTTYAFLARISVAAGQPVGSGALVGEAGPRLLWTARLGDAYLDPAVLLAASGAAPVRLVPNRRPRAGAEGPVRHQVTAVAAEWALGAGP